jgi:predicted nucleic acid-binding protein
MATPKYLLDTGVLMRYLRGRGDVVRFTRGLHRKREAVVSAITHMELFIGAHREEEYSTRKLLSRFQVISVDAEIGQRAGQLIRQQKAQGHALSVADAIIAATALQHNLMLVTFNPGDFDLPGLSLYPLDLLA